MNSFASRLPSLKATTPEWGPILLGLLAMYVPTYYGLFNGLWGMEEQAQGPIVFVLSLWLLYRIWPRMMEKSAGKPSSAMGWLVFSIGLILYVIGHAFEIYIFEVGSFIWMIAAILLIKRGSNALATAWFPLFFMLFMIPLPGAFVISVTMPMKIAVSYVTEHILYWAGYPIARSGVILQIGQYQLLVATACAGLQTLLTLEALGLFYLNVVQHTSVFRNAILAVFIVPISFISNVVRVMSLTLITYYYGDEAGQGFLHEFAGMVLFLSALIFIVSIDALLQYIVKLRSLKASQ